MKLQTFSGYSTQEYMAIFGARTPRLLIGSGLEERKKFDQSTMRPVETAEIDSKRTYVYYPGLGVQAIKLPPKYELSEELEDLMEVELIAPEACVVGRDVYVRAESIKAK